MPEHSHGPDEPAIPQFTGTIPGQRRASAPTGGARPFGPPPADDTIPGQADGTTH
ncbi:hypothetical protein ACFV1W_25215 [Kitasatospora sp. NPDC059648]|uniref:hypothetical protein n=1 Tax=Kitasatospora sp. NPDC059648 TaxID=3346894 RepID=UPI0036CD32BB